MSSSNNRELVFGSLSPSDDEKRGMRDLASREAAREKAKQRDDVFKKQDDPRFYERDLAATSMEKIRKDLAQQRHEAKEKVAKAIQERLAAKAAQAGETQQPGTTNPADGNQADISAKVPQPSDKKASGS